MMDALILDNLSKQYQNGTLALQGIHLRVQEGEFFGLLGPNGAGKSTTIGIIASLVKKTSGQVHVFGYDLEKQTKLAKSKIGLVPQEFNFNVFEKVIDIVTNQGGYYGLPRRVALEKSEYYLTKLGLWAKRNEPARFLSGGMKRRLLIARGLVHDPKLLILDEPTAGVDIELRRSTWSFLKEINQKGTTIILTTHNLEEAESLCKQVAIIDKGHIIANTSVKELIKKLDKETIILDLKSPLIYLPRIQGFHFEKLDDLTMEVSFTRNRLLNDLFSELAMIGCEVISLRNKANRLEELFLDLVKSNGK
ncbi:MAG: ABC transporter ATP-binding protein [Gammaproteobacteria bacterium]